MHFKMLMGKTNPVDLERRKEKQMGRPIKSAETVGGTTKIRSNGTTLPIGTSGLAGNQMVMKSFVTGGDLGLNEGLNGAPLLKVEVVLGVFVPDLNDPPLPENFPACFSITTEFFP